MQAQLVTVLAGISTLSASVAGHPATTAARQTGATLPALSWSTSFATENWSSPYTEGPDGYIQWTAHWDVFANTGYVDGLPGFAVSCSGQFDDNNPLAGAWTLCTGFPGDSATVEGQLTGPGGNFLAAIRHNVTLEDGKTTIVTATGDGFSSDTGSFEFTVQSVETI
ncbi:hypothetical protein F4678DRAFT_305144 [Xylaria arbuscula]|nr:hypothetical protein F4678DRAFT_305144 [Xylaria arbuscula]